MGDVLDRTQRELFEESAAMGAQPGADLIEAAFAMLVRQVVPLMERMDSARLGAALREEHPGQAVADIFAELAIEAVVVGENDALTAGRARAVYRRRELLAEAGGAMSSAALAKTLGITRQAVEKRRRRGTLLAVPQASGDWVFPLAQFGPEGRPLPGLVEVLRAFKIQDPWMRLAELIAPDADLGSRSIIDVLREEGRNGLPAVLKTVTRVGDHGA